MTSGVWATITCLTAGIVGLVCWNLSLNRSLQSLFETNRVKRDYSQVKHVPVAPTSYPPGFRLREGGVAGGSHSDLAGGGSDYLCLPRVPQWDPQQRLRRLYWNTTTSTTTTTTTTPAPSSQNRRRNNRNNREKTIMQEPEEPQLSVRKDAYIYGGEFRGRSPFGRANLRSSTFLDQDVVCAVCYSEIRRSQLMIPGRRDCFHSWTKEYEGFLMTAPSGAQAQHHYACVDRQAEADQKGFEQKEGALFYPVRAVCGSLPCPNYVQDWELTCVVCTK